MTQFDNDGDSVAESEYSVRSERLADEVPSPCGSSTCSSVALGKGKACTPRMKRRLWTESEDAVLRFAVENVQERMCSTRERLPWLEIAKMVEGRTAKQCRDRWGSIDNAAKRDWTPAEDAHLLDLYARYANRWVKIAAHFEDRNDNMIKSRFRALQRQGATSKAVAAAASGQQQARAQAQRRQAMHQQQQQQQQQHVVAAAPEQLPLSPVPVLESPPWYRYNNGARHSSHQSHNHSHIQSSSQSKRAHYERGTSSAERGRGSSELAEEFVSAKRMRTSTGQDLKYLAIPPLVTNNEPMAFNYTPNHALPPAPPHGLSHHHASSSSSNEADHHMMGHSSNNNNGPSSAPQPAAHSGPETASAPHSSSQSASQSVTETDWVNFLMDQVTV